MVRGLDRFREHFAGYNDRYVLIGGTAATLTMEEAGLTFRATKDLDILLVVEALDGAFGERMWLRDPPDQHRTPQVLPVRKARRRRLSTHDRVVLTSAR